MTGKLNHSTCGGGVPVAATGGFPYNRQVATPIPADFAELAAKLTANGLVDHYRHHLRVIKRWFAETGIQPFVRKAQKQEPPRRPRRVQAYAGPKSAFTGTLRRDHSTEGRAADVLRKYAPVYRCGERGGIPEDQELLTHWRYGAAVLTRDELIERAKRYGFEERWVG